MNDSPFSPTFGSWPAVLAGRSDLEQQLNSAFNSGPRDPWYTTLIIGNRGTGKTVALSLAEDIAARNGYHSVYLYGHPGLPERLVSQLEKLEGEPPRRTTRHSATIGLPGGVARYTASTEAPQPKSAQTAGLLDAMASAVQRVTKAGASGILIAIDEIHDAEPPELQNLGGAIQEVTRRNQLPIAFVGAGLPSVDDLVLDTKGTTFLERCARYDTGPLNPKDTAMALEQPFIDAGIDYVKTGMDAAIEATNGNPFAIQFVGHEIWIAHPDKAAKVSKATFAEATERALEAMARQIVQPIWKRLSEKDQLFMIAAAHHDEVDVPVREISRMTGQTPNSTNLYRSRLIKAGVIRASGRGKITIVHTAMRRWIRRNQEPSARMQSGSTSTRSPN